MPIEQFDLNLLPAEARSSHSVEFAQVASEFIEGQFWCVGKNATARVVQGRIEVECETNGGDRGFAFRLIDNYRDGWLAGRAILLRLWFSQHPEDLASLRRVANFAWCRMPEDALRYYERFLRCLLDLEPDDADVRIALGENLLHLGDHKAGFSVVHPLTATPPPDSERRTRCGLLLLRSGQPEIAQEHFLAALGLNDRNQAAWMGLAESCSALGDLETAGRAYDKVIEIDWLDPMATEAHWKRVVNAAVILFHGKQVAASSMKEEIPIKATLAVSAS